MRVSVIISTKDREQIFAETLKSAVQAIRNLDAEIIVVNDSKTSVPAIPETYQRVTLVNNPKAGVASARNTGAALAAGELLLFLDNDIVISEQSMNQVLKLHRDMPDLALNLNWEYPPDMVSRMNSTQFGRFMQTFNLTTFKGWYSDNSWRDNALFPSKSVASFHLSLTRQNFFKTKGYAEQFPHAGFEDYDFPLQLKEVGLKFYIDSRVTVFHNEVDRMNMSNWLISQQRRAHTRKVAADLGYKEVALRYGGMKKIILKTIGSSVGLFMFVLSLTPNVKTFDGFYFKVLAILQSGVIYKGYNEG